MSDDLENKGQQDRLRINVHEDHELRYWTKELQCTPDELREAVNAVGVMAEDVRLYFSSKSA